MSNNQPQEQQDECGRTNETNDDKRSIDSYYERKVGLSQTILLVLNAGLMLYAHLGLSGVIMTSLDPATVVSESAADNAANNCNENDKEIWTNNLGYSTLPEQSDFCIRNYGESGMGCLANATCIELCVKDVHGYSDDCAVCFGAILPCGVNSGCTFLCIADSTSAECLDCLAPCFEKFGVCSGLPQVRSTVARENSVTTSAATGNDSCNSFDLDEIETWHNVYNMTFVKSVRDTWNNDAKMLACLIVLFSGVWPYAKNILLVIIWYLPMTVKHQTLSLVWLSWLSKYTLVDVFAVIGILVAVQLQIKIGGVVEVVVRGEPRFGIICFFLATFWEFVQIEVLKVLHERKVLAAQLVQEEKESLLSSKVWLSVLVLLASIGLYISGAVTEFLYISNFDYGSDAACVKSYNLVQIGNGLISEVSMSGNNAPGQTWFLYFIYVILNLALPILVHVMQMMYIVGRIRSKRLGKVIQWATAVWCFSCIEVLLIGVVAVESKFEHFIINIADIEDEGLLNIKSGLGNGFFILIPYSVITCFLQYSLTKGSGVSKPILPNSSIANVGEGNEV